MINEINSLEEVIKSLKDVAIAEQEAFNVLYELKQQIHEIAERAIRDGEKGYKRAITQIVELCREVN